MTKPQPLSTSRLMAYNSVEMGISGMEFALRIYLLIFYTDRMGLKASYAGYAIGLAVLFDAIFDPAAGTLSDRLRDSWGGRRLFILLGGVSLSIAFASAFAPVAAWGQLEKFLYLLVFYIWINFSMSILSIAHAALGGEMSRDPHEATRLFGWRTVLSNVGGALAVLLPSCILFLRGGNSSSRMDAKTYFLNGIAFGALTLITVFATFRASKGFDGKAPQSEATDEKLSWSAWRGALGNRPFLVMITAFFVGSVGVAITTSFSFYYYTYVLDLGAAQINLILGVFMLTCSLAVFAWVALAKRVERIHALFGAMLFFGVMNCVLYPILPPRQLLFPLIASVVGGICIGSTALLEAMVVDAANFEAVRTGRRPLGLYFGLWRTSSKMARALALFVSGEALQLIGFIPNTRLPAHTLRDIALVFGPGVGACFLLSSVFVFLMPMTDKDAARLHEQVMSRLNASAVPA